MNSVVFGKTMENVWKHGNIKLVKTEKKRNYFVLEANYHITKFFPKNVLAKRTQILTKEPVYLGLSILEISIIVMYEFWFD